MMSNKMKASTIMADVSEADVRAVIEEMRKKGLPEVPVKALDGEQQRIRLRDRSFDVTLEVTRAEGDKIIHDQYSVTGRYTGTQVVDRKTLEVTTL